MTYKAYFIRRGHFCPLLRFFVINPFNKKIAISNQIDFQSNFIPNKVESFPILSFLEITFQNLSIFLTKILLK